MPYLKNTPFYYEAFNELNYPFGNYYLFENFVVSEINEDIVYSWEEHGKQVSYDIGNLYESNGANLIYISNRINNYAVQPSDWLRFYGNNFKLKGYGIVSYSHRGYFNSILERLFSTGSFKSFTSLDEAIVWAKQVSETKFPKPLGLERTMPSKRLHF